MIHTTVELELSLTDQIVYIEFEIVGNVTINEAKYYSIMHFSILSTMEDFINSKNN